MSVVLGQTEPDPQKVIADFQRQLAARTAERDEALAQQAATAEVLQVINSSPGDLAPVFDAMLEKAMRLCEAAFGAMFMFDENRFTAAALRGVPTAYAEFLAENTTLPGPGTAPYRFLRGGERSVIEEKDLAASEPYRTGDLQRCALVDIGGARSTIQVPLWKDTTVLGVMTLFRQEVRPFSDKQITLLQSFADQAVIAMEVARLMTETREALEQQTATAEVLQVINSSPGDLAPVFDAMLEKATSLCEAAFGILWTYDGERYHAVGFRNVPNAYVEFLRQPPPLSPETPLGRIAAGEPLAQIADLAAEEIFGLGSPLIRKGVQLGGFRTVLGVALRKEGTLLGAFTIYRQEVRLFSDKQIVLLQNFAAQAVIAMENARLLTDTREALEQQTATAEVLQVINASPGDLAPVFDAILEKAHTLCGAVYGALGTYDGEHYFRAVAMRGYPEVLAERLRQGFDGRSNPVTIPLIEGAPFVHIPNLAEIDHPIPRAVAELGGLRTGLFLALRKDGVLLGHLSVTRPEVRPFAEKEIALLENFAAQAVIAMENARLLGELRRRTSDLEEALEQQTATSEVLKVINASPGDLGPVFEAILEKAMRLCGASFGELRTYDGERFLLAAARGTPSAYVDYYRQNDTGRYGAGTGPARLLAGEPVVHIPDLIATEPYQRGDPDRRAIVDLAGAQAYILVPLLVDEAVQGFILIYREEARPFSEKQIGLLQSFAAQAVIAMDNARLLNEIRQRQAELRVTFDNMGDGVAMFDADLRLAAWNMNFQRILDVPDEFVTERPSSTDLIRYLAQHGEFGAVDVETEVQRISERMDQQWSNERARPDGRIIEVRNNPVPGGGFVLIYSDVTERKRAEETIRIARDAAEKALAELRTAQASLIHAEKMASLGQLTAGIAHEIKNPLNFVNNFAGLSIELLDELKQAASPVLGSADDKIRAEIDETVDMLTSNLDKIAEHGKRADGIVKSMLEHSRGASGERRSVDLNSLVDEALNLAFHGARAHDQGFNITMERDFDPALSLTEVVPQDMTRVFLNVIGNGFYAATKRKQQGDADFRPVLKVTTRDLGDAVEIRIRDNGIGIPPEHREKLFQPFFTTKPTGEGTGLGLSISYDIVTQEHGGTITVESEPGQFTEFTVRLPQREKEATRVSSAA